MTPPSHSEFDAYKPAEIAALVERVGVAKAELPALQTVVLGLLAGAFIAFGGMFYTLVITDSGLGFGPAGCSAAWPSRSA